MIPASGRFPGGGHGNPLQYSCLDNPTDRRAWWNTVHRVAKSQIRLKLLSTQAPVPYISGVTQYLSFYVWLISLSVTSSVFIHVIEGDSNSLLFKVEDIPVYVCTAFCLCIQLLVPPFGCYRECSCWSHLLAVIVNGVAVNVGVQIPLGYPVFLFWCIYQQVC